MQSVMTGHSHQVNGSELPGAWLCSEGPYRQVIADQCAINPGLINEDPKNHHISFAENHASVSLLQVEDKGQVFCLTRTNFKDTKSVKQHLETRSPGNGICRRVYLIEGLAPDIIEILGTYFKMDPSLFLFQERTTLWPTSQRSSDPPTLPTLVNPKRESMLRYYELRDFKTRFDDFALCCAKTGRHIGLTRLSGALDTVGIVRRKCTTWSQTYSTGGWDVIVLCDPPVDVVLDGLRGSGKRYPVQSRPFNGGYRGFLKYNENDTNSQLLGPPRTSMMEDLCFYLTRHTAIIDNWDCPSAVTLFANKIVASHYLQLVEYIRGVISQIQWSLSRKDQLSIFSASTVEESWSDLQGLIRRCSEYCADIELVLLNTGATMKTPIPEVPPDWKDISADFNFIAHQLNTLKVRADRLESSIAGLASIVGNQLGLREAKQSVREARQVRALTYVGLVFIPLAYSASLLSMSDGYQPGAERFWIYFAVCIPMVILVFSIMALVQLGYDEKAIFSIGGYFRSLFPSGMVRD